MCLTGRVQSSLTKPKTACTQSKPSWWHRLAACLKYVNELAQFVPGLHRRCGFVPRRGGAQSASHKKNMSTFDRLGAFEKGYPAASSKIKEDR